MTLLTLVQQIYYVICLLSCKNWNKIASCTFLSSEKHLNVHIHTLYLEQIRKQDDGKKIIIYYGPLST